MGFVRDIKGILYADVIQQEVFSSVFSRRKPSGANCLVPPLIIEK